MKKNTKTQKSTKISASSIFNELKNPILVVAGLVVGKFAGDFADKSLKVSRSGGIATMEDGSQAGMKGYIAPVALVGAGVAGMIMVKNSDVKMFSAGVAANGLYKGANMLAKKDILNGLAGPGDSDFPQIAPSEQMMYQLPEYFPMVDSQGGSTATINGELPIANF